MISSSAHVACNMMMSICKSIPSDRFDVFTPEDLNISPFEEDATMAQSWEDPLPGLARRLFAEEDNKSDRLSETATAGPRYEFKGCGKVEHKIQRKRKAAWDIPAEISFKQERQRQQTHSSRDSRALEKAFDEMVLILDKTIEDKTTVDPAYCISVMEKGGLYGLFTEKEKLEIFHFVETFLTVKRDVEKIIDDMKEIKLSCLHLQNQMIAESI